MLFSTLCTTLCLTHPLPAPSAATSRPTKVRQKAFSPSNLGPESPTGNSLIIWTNTCPTLSPTISVRSARILQKSSALERSHTRQTSLLFNSNASTHWDARTNTQSHSHPLWTSAHIGRRATRQAPSTSYLRSCHTWEVPAAVTTAALPREKTAVGIPLMT
jgi:hypothetical protein